MAGLLILLVGLLIMNSDPKVSQSVKTILWMAMVIIGILLGALSYFKVA